MDQNFYEYILDSLSDAMYILDSEGNFIFVNKELIDVTGYSKSDFMHFNSNGLFRNGIIDRCLFKEVSKEKKSKTIIQHITQKDELIKKLLVTSTPIFDGKGNIKNVVGHLSDVEKMNIIYHDALTKNEFSVIQHNNIDMTKIASANIIAKSNKMKEILIQVGKFASYDTTILIQGESGTGKEVIANYIHEMSPRKEKEMVSINCASLPDALLESELFGYIKGAFTGASNTGKKGLIEIADGGTLFLDEINSLPLTTQGKLLRILETKMLQRVGSVKPSYIDFKLIAATNSNLKNLVNENKFRNDLYYRLNVLPITIPPLRERKDDIIPLTDFFIEYCCNKYGRKKKFSTNLYDKLLKYEWPGNIRELKNFIERIILLSSYSVNEIDDIPFPFDEFIISNENNNNINTIVEPNIISKPNTESYECFDLKEIEGKNLKDAVKLFEKFIIDRTYKNLKSSRKTANLLGVNQSTIVRKRNK
ncbi:MAG: sigma 54-interacting transcriptional regulator [Peptostreptococcaceae bacterium]|nr:sigma 54-interacting transcriptional regulator [Peptostreptococcaceae bacterium]